MREPHHAIAKFIVKERSPHDLEIRAEHIVEACRLLKQEGYEHLSLISTVDWKDRWEVLYHLVRYGDKNIATLRVTLPYGNPELPSVCSVWKAANWHERENYDLMGIRFTGHPDLRRILLPENYEEHPLRKEVLHGNRS